MIYFHKLGTKQEEDQLVYRRPDHPDWSFWRRADGRRQVPGAVDLAAAPIRRTRCSCAMRPPRPMRRSTKLIGDFENQFSFIGNEGTKFYFLTDLDAPTKRIVAMDIDQAGPRAS